MNKRQKYHAALLAAGLCTNGCGRPSRPGRGFCRQCASQESTCTEKRRKRLIACGLCSICGVRPRVNKHKCAKCRDRGKAQHAATRLKLKIEVMTHYCGGSLHCMCPRCKETIPILLTIDHINGNGNTHRSKIGWGSETMYRWLKNNGYPKGYQVLCFTCNTGKYLNGGVCPHLTVH